MSPFIPIRDRPFFVPFPKPSSAVWPMVRSSISVVALEPRTSSLALVFVRPLRECRDTPALRSEPSRPEEQYQESHPP